MMASLLRVVLLGLLTCTDASALQPLRLWQPRQPAVQQRIEHILDSFSGRPTIRRRVVPCNCPHGEDRATIQAAMDSRDGLAAATVVEVVLAAGTYTTDGPLLVPSYTILRGELLGAVVVVLSDTGAGALAQKPGLYDDWDGSLTHVQVLDLTFDLLKFGVDTYAPRDAACCPAVRRLLENNNVGNFCPEIGNCTQSSAATTATANSPVFFHARGGINHNVLFANVTTHGGVYVPGSYLDACGRHMNGVFNWAFGPAKHLAIVDCYIDRAGRDSLNIAGASEVVTVANLSISNSQDDGISIHASNIMWYRSVNVSGQVLQPNQVAVFNETGQMRDVLITSCHVWNGAARGIDIIGDVAALNISSNRIGPTARSGILLDTTAASAVDGRPHVQRGVIEHNDFIEVGHFTNGLLNRCVHDKYENVSRRGSGSTHVVIKHSD